MKTNLCRKCGYGWNPHKKRRETKSYCPNCRTVLWNRKSLQSTVTSTIVKYSLRNHPEMTCRDIAAQADVTFQRVAQIIKELGLGQRHENNRPTN